MQYPLISEYIEAIRYAEDNFDKLSNLRPVLDDNGNPVMSSGNFAVVFKMKDIETDKLYAVKCFIREQEERQERYREIIKVLDEIKSPYFVSAHYYDNELFVDTTQDDETEFPVLVMDWVDGLCLDEYMHSIKNDITKRESFAYKFQDFVCWLLPKHFAHGDLKPDNIIVKNDGNILLVDYDGMYVPSLCGRRALELGTPMYRFKNRTLDDFNEYIDDYAAVVLLLIVKINALNPTEIDKCFFSNTFDTIYYLKNYINEKSIAPLLSAYIIVSTFGRLEHEQLCCLLTNNSTIDYKKDMNLHNYVCTENTTAMIELGYLYIDGEIIPENISKALQWYEMAGKQEDTDSLYNIGLIYYYGYDKYTNYIKAIEFFEKSSKLNNNSKAQYMLALCYYKGLGTIRDRSKAITWWTKAANNYNITAMQTLACLFFDDADKEIANYWFSKAYDFQKKYSLTISEVITKYEFLETLTIEQFKEKHKNSKLIMVVNDNRLILKCGTGMIFFIDGKIPECPMISLIHMKNDNKGIYNSLWIIHEEGYCAAPVIADF